MGKEIEHKYLVTSEDYKDVADTSYIITQGYLSKDKERVVRIRILDNSGFITIKGKTSGDTRHEYEYQIPLKDAVGMLELCIGEVIKKKRWIVSYMGNKWEVDEFINRDFPTIAEIELPESTHDYLLPPFVGKDVTGDPKYYNSNI